MVGMPHQLRVHFVTYRVLIHWCSCAGTDSTPLCRALRAASLLVRTLARGPALTAGVLQSLQPVPTGSLLGWRLAFLATTIPFHLVHHELRHCGLSCLDHGQNIRPTGPASCHLGSFLASDAQSIQRQRQCGALVATSHVSTGTSRVVQKDLQRL